MDISPARSPTAASPPSAARQATGRAQHQEQEQVLEAEKRSQEQPPQAYLNTQGQATGRLLNASA